MDKQEVIERLNNKLDEVFAFQRSFEPLTGAYMECESKASAYMIAINYVEQLNEPQKVKVPAFVAGWIEQAKKECRTFFEVLSDIEGACFYHKGDEPTYKWVFDNDNGVKHQEIFARAWLDGYEVEEEPKWVVQVGNLYFCGWEDTTAQFVMNTMLGEEELIIKYKNEGTASAVAKNLGGTVEKVEV